MLYQDDIFKVYYQADENEMDGEDEMEGGETEEGEEDSEEDM